MMLKFISLLGTNPYLPCNYYLGESIVNDCCYIQKALVEILIEQGMIPDKVFIFTTELAYMKNWKTNAYDKKRPGLKDELVNMSKNIGFIAKNTVIPEGQNEEELWGIFNTILDNLEDEDEIILDVTHSFRYLPMLTFIIINYARIVKKCSLKAVYYGAFEVLGDARRVANLPIVERNAPIFDLTPFIDLFDWTLAIDRYLATGDASMVENLTSLEVKKINKKISKEATNLDVDPSLLFKDSKSLINLLYSMKKFSDTVFTCRGPELTNVISNLKSNINAVFENMAYEKIKPLSPIMEMLEGKFSNFSFEDDNINVIETAKWCYENKMYQQGLTLLEEGIINFICKKWNLDILNVDDRNKVTSYAYNVSRNNIDVDYESLSMSNENAKNLFKLLYNIGNMRNDINHAGWRENPAKDSVFESALKDFIVKAESLILNKEDEIYEKKLLLIFSHKLNKRQKEEAKERFNISRFIELDPELLIKWMNIPPNLEDLKEYLEDLTKWIDQHGNPGDYALVQGDFGAIKIIVDYCISKRIIPIYATTQRKVTEEKSGEVIKISREFEHVMFRKYQQ